MATQASTDKEREEELRERFADKHALKFILRKYNTQWRERIMASVFADLDLE